MSKTAADTLTCVLIYVFMAPFVGPMMNLHNNLFTSLWLKRKSFRLPLIVLNLIKVAIAVSIAMIPLAVLFNVKAIWLFFIIVGIMVILGRSDGMTGWYLQLETRFLRNFNERIIKREEALGMKETWLDDKLHIISSVSYTHLFSIFSIITQKACALLSILNNISKLDNAVPICYGNLIKKEIYKGHTEEDCFGQQNSF